MNREVTLNNGEKITDCGVTIFDQKGKPLSELPPGWTVSYANSNPTVAQVVQESERDIVVDITTESDDVGDALIEAKVTDPDGNILLDTDGTPPALLVHVINSKPGTASFTAGSVVSEG